MSKITPESTDDTMSNVHKLGQAITTCCTVDQHALRVKYSQLKAQKDKRKQSQLTQKLIEDIQKSSDKAMQRKKSLPKIPFSDDLPINQRREEIAELIQNNQVVVVAGETGSGKTTQIPKICLSLGLGNKGLIGHTQPRRIAARTVGKRIADELSTPFGDIVGYQVRFADQLSDNTRVKLMTDGVLLSEFQQDKFLNKYEVIIIDEAHERSLNIDFLLGLLKQLLKKRKDLKLIITSATIDLEKFSQHFDRAPIIEVSGRTYPVDVLYQSDNNDEPETQSLPDTIAATVSQIIEGEARGEFIANGDILVFCAGEREIRDATKAISDRSLPVEILPLYSRLGIAEQNKVFQSAQRRKVVLATNVAETSITVPGIAYVIDPGVARLSRYSFRSKVQRLQIEPISQASANQRKGRCGRVANGVCIRLYSEEDFNARPSFTDAELLRSNLAAVILQLLQLKVPDIDQFPFLDKPDNRLLNDGFKLLDELQAINKQRRLTNLGRTLSRLPLDPKYGRILLDANTLNCLSEMIVIVAALSIQDPREFPADKQQAAREKHRLLQHPTSDFYSYLHLWFAIEQQRKALTNKHFKDYCKKNFLSIMRIFEWRDMVRQLRQTVTRLDWDVPKFTEKQQQQYLSVSNNSKQEKKNAKADESKLTKTAINQAYENIHRALLSGLLGNIAVHEENNDYLATRGRKLMVFPSSVLAKKTKFKKQYNKPTKAQKKPLNAKWIMANELIETSRLFAHTAAEIQPDWIHKAGKHMLRYSYSSPNYHERAGVVKALRRASLYGLTLRDKTSVVYSEISPDECRQLFIQQALVEGGYERHPQYRKINTQSEKGQATSDFFTHNKALIEEIELLEAKTRKRNLLIADTEIYQLYDERIPEHVLSWVQFEQWRKTAEKEQKDILKFKQSQLTLNGTDLPTTSTSLKSEQSSAAKSENLRNTSDSTAFPESMSVNGRDLILSYHFNPSDPNDGVTLELPIALLEPFPEFIGDWLVPGLLREKCIALIKTLPKNIRKRYAPAANAVDRVLPNMQAENRPLHIVLGENLKRAFGDDIPNDAWQVEALDSYYQLNYHLVDSDKSRTSIQQSRNLSALKKSYSEYVTESLRIENAPERKRFEKDNIQQWDFGELLEKVEYQHQGMMVRAYPMLQIRSSTDEQSEKQKTVSTNKHENIVLRLHESPIHADYFTRQVLVELARTPLKQSLSYLQKELLKANAVSLQLLSLAPNKQAQQTLASHLINAAILHCCFSKDLPRNKVEFDECIAQGNKEWLKYALDMESALVASAKKAGDIHRMIAGLGHLTLEMDMIIEDIKNQLYDLFADGFLHYTPLHQLKQYPRYLKCMQLRLEHIGLASMQTPDYFEQHQQDVEKYVANKVKQVKASDELLNTAKEAAAFVCHSQPKLKEHLVMLQEWRVSIFAQQLKTQYSVSEKRVLKHWGEVVANSC